MWIWAIFHKVDYVQQMNCNFLAMKNVLVGWAVLISIFTGIVQASANSTFKLDNAILAEAEAKYGSKARKRLLAWEYMIQHDASTSDMEKLEKVNDFFNQFRFVSDYEHWKRRDYWATPVELIASEGGDCEDFSVAKYFTLKALGIPEEKLNLTYVRAISLGQAHMVLTYYENPDDVPLVLDNLIGEVQPVYKRADLQPVYSFNRTGLWVAKRRGRGELVGKSDALELWHELLLRMPQELI